MPGQPATKSSCPSPSRSKPPTIDAPNSFEPEPPNAPDEALLIDFGRLPVRLLIRAIQTWLPVEMGPGAPITALVPQRASAVPSLPSTSCPVTRDVTTCEAPLSTRTAPMFACPD